MLTHWSQRTDPAGYTVTAEEHVFTDEEMATFAESLGKVRKRPSKAAQRRSAAQQIQADLDDLADLHGGGEGT